MIHSKYGFHFVGAKLRDGSPVPPDGEWLCVTSPLKMCGHGLHGSPTAFEALQYAPGTVLCWCEFGGNILRGTDKFCAESRRILARFDATEILRAHARQSALSVIHLWRAPEVVRQYLGTGDESIRSEARSAAAAYADADAAYAAYAAAAADAAAYARKRILEQASERLQAAVDAKFKELCP